MSEPIPNGEDYSTIRQLKQATFDHCLAWWEWRWSETFSTVAFGLDYSGRLNAWGKVAKNEREAYRVVDRLQRAIREALDQESWIRKADPFTGFHGQALKRAAPHLEAAEKAMSAFAWSAGVPVIEPSRREWLGRVASRCTAEDLPGYARSLAEIPLAELAIYSILAGFWPTSIPGPRIPVDGDHPVTVVRVLGEERKYLRKALEGYRAQEEAVRAEIEALTGRDT